MLPNIIFSTVPYIPESNRSFPNLLINIQACSLKNFGNDFRSLARTEHKMLAVAILNGNQKLVCLKKLFRTVTLISKKGEWGRQQKQVRKSHSELCSPAPMNLEVAPQLRENEWPISPHLPSSPKTLERAPEFAYLYLLWESAHFLKHVCG